MGSSREIVNKALMDAQPRILILMHGRRSITAFHQQVDSMLAALDCLHDFSQPYVTLVRFDDMFIERP